MKKKTVRVAFGFDEDEPKYRDEEGYAYNRHLTIHKGTEGEGRGKWIITHNATGYALPGYWRTREWASRYARHACVLFEELHFRDIDEFKVFQKKADYPKFMMSNLKDAYVNLERPKPWVTTQSPWHDLGWLNFITAYQLPEAYGEHWPDDADGWNVLGDAYEEACDYRAMLWARLISMVLQSNAKVEAERKAIREQKEKKAITEYETEMQS